MRALVGSGEGVVGRQDRLAVAAAEVDRVHVAGEHVAGGVAGGHGDALGLARSVWRREAANLEHGPGPCVERD